MTVINDLMAPRSTPDLGIEVNPQGALVTYTVNGHTYITQARFTPINAPITFTSVTEFSQGDPDLQIVSWDWDFGDGTIGAGPIVQHTYRAASPTMRVHLAVTDNLGRQFSVGKQLSLAKLLVATLVPAIVVDINEKDHPRPLVYPSHTLFP